MVVLGSFRETVAIAHACSCLQLRFGDSTSLHFRSTHLVEFVNDSNVIIIPYTPTFDSCLTQQLATQYDRHKVWLHLNLTRNPVKFVVELGQKSEHKQVFDQASTSL